MQLVTPGYKHLRILVILFCWVIHHKYYCCDPVGDSFNILGPDCGESLDNAKSAYQMLSVLTTFHPCLLIAIPRLIYSPMICNVHLSFYLCSDLLSITNIIISSKVISFLSDAFCCNLCILSHVWTNLNENFCIRWWKFHGTADLNPMVHWFLNVYFSLGAHSILLIWGFGFQETVTIAFILSRELWEFAS